MKAKDLFNFCCKNCAEKKEDCCMVNFYGIINDDGKPLIAKADNSCINKDDKGCQLGDKKPILCDIHPLKFYKNILYFHPIKECLASSLLERLYLDRDKDIFDWINKNIKNFLGLVKKFPEIIEWENYHILEESSNIRIVYIIKKEDLF